MPQYLVANYLPCRREEVRLRHFPGQQRQDGAEATRWYGARHRWPYTETKEHMGGFWILEAADMDEALHASDRRE